MIDLSVIRGKAALDPETWGPVLAEHERQLAGGSEPPLPSLLRQAVSVMRAAGTLLVEGADQADAEEQERRWSICRSCSDHFRPSDQRCGALDGCGCYLAQKIPLRAMHCPISMW